MTSCVKGEEGVAQTGHGIRQVQNLAGSDSTTQGIFGSGYQSQFRIACDVRHEFLLNVHPWI